MALTYDSKARSGLIQFTDRDGARRSLRLKNISKTGAERFHTHVESLNEARRTNSSVRGETIAFVNDLGDKFHQRLVKLGLIEPRKPSAEETLNKPITLGEWLEKFKTMKAPDWKPASVTVFGHTSRNLLAFFGSEKPLTEITTLDAENFERFLKAEELAKATMAKRCSIARSVFDAARKHRLLESNPFRDAAVNVVVRGNKQRQFFVDRATIAKVFSACPDAEWRLLIGLARFGGLRVPSEALSLRWEHVNWERQEILIPSPKTEHHEGHESRTIPMFPELKELLGVAFDQAADGAVWVIAKHRPASANGSSDWQATNLRSQFERILRRAGVKPWARLWVNLRSSRATELADLFPSHVCAEWLGHCERVANEHYRQTTRDHFEKAITPSECSALHVALQSGTELGGSERLLPLASRTIRTKNANTYKKEAAPSRNLEPLRWTIQDSNL